MKSTRLDSNSIEIVMTEQELYVIARVCDMVSGVARAPCVDLVRERDNYALHPVDAVSLQAQGWGIEVRYIDEDESEDESEDENEDESEDKSEDEDEEMCLNDDPETVLSRFKESQL